MMKGCYGSWERTECIKLARAKAEKSGATYFVVWEGERYDVCTEYDLVTFYDGIRDQDIIFCTEDDW
jgi:hypothetical protein